MSIITKTLVNDLSLASQYVVNDLDLVDLSNQMMGNISISYNDSTKDIILDAGSNQTKISCIDFLKDGMLSSAELCGTKLVLKFNNDANKTAISVELSSLEEGGELTSYLDRRTGGEISGDVIVNGNTTANGSLSIVSGNYVQTNSIDAIDMYSSSNGFIQAVSCSYGKSSIGSRGFYVLSVILPNKLKISGDINILPDAQSCLWSVALGSSLNSQFGKIADISGQILEFDGNFVGQLTSYSTSSEAQLTGLIAKDDNAFYCPIHPEVGNVDLTSFNCQHAEGGAVHAIAQYSHAEGRLTFAEGRYSHAEGGNNTTAGGVASHAEGFGSKALGNRSHAEGSMTSAAYYATHAEGEKTKAFGYASHAEGINTLAGDGEKPIIDASTEIGRFSHSEGNGSWAYGNASHAEGRGSLALGQYSHSEGSKSLAYGEKSHAEGGNTLASADMSHSEGEITSALWRGGHSEGKKTKAYMYAHAEGSETVAGYDLCASNAYLQGDTASHAEGYQTSAIARFSHAEGYGTQAGILDPNDRPNLSIDGNVEKNFNIDQAAHAEGISSIATGIASHAAGIQANAKDEYSFVWSGIRNDDGSLKSSNGRGSFNIYPVGGIDGIYVNGSRLISQMLGRKTDDSIIDHNGVIAYGAGTNVADGNQAIAIGSSVSAIAGKAIALGQSTSASGIFSLAIGKESKAKGQYSTAIGYKNIAEGNKSLALGSQTSAGHGAISFGDSCIASALYSVVGGLSSKVLDKSEYSMAFGSNNVISGASSSHGALKSVIFGSNNSINHSGTASNMPENLIVVGASNSIDSQKNSQSIFVGGLSNIVNVTTNNASFVYGRSNVLSIAGLDFIAGEQLSGNHNWSTIFGHSAKSTKERQFIWSGTTNKYDPVEQAGTFNVDPASGLRGFFIGKDNFIQCVLSAVQMMSDAQKNAFKSALGLA